MKFVAGDTVKRIGNITDNGWNGYANSYQPFTVAKITTRIFGVFVEDQFGELHAAESLEHAPIEAA